MPQPEPDGDSALVHPPHAAQLSCSCRHCQLPPPSDPTSGFLPHPCSCTVLRTVKLLLRSLTSTDTTRSMEPALERAVVRGGKSASLSLSSSFQNRHNASHHMGVSGPTTPWRKCLWLKMYSRNIRQYCRNLNETPGTVSLCINLYELWASKRGIKLMQSHFISISHSHQVSLPQSL